MLNEKVMVIHLIIGLIKKTMYKMSQYFSKPYKYFERNVKVELDFSSYLTKLDFKNVTGVDTSKLAAKSDLASLKTKIDKIDVDKLKIVPVDSRKLSSVVNNDVVKKILLLISICHCWIHNQC